jgi:hypothetical protein
MVIFDNDKECADAVDVNGYETAVVADKPVRFQVTKLRSSLMDNC